MHSSKLKTLKRINNLTRNCRDKGLSGLSCEQEEDLSNEEVVTSLVMYTKESQPLHQPGWRQCQQV